MFVCLKDALKSRQQTETLSQVDLFALPHSEAADRTCCHNAAFYQDSN